MTSSTGFSGRNYLVFLFAVVAAAITIALAFIVAIGSTWIMLPKLVTIFNETKGELPMNTQALIWLGNFFETNGLWAVPAIILFVSLFGYILFFNKKTNN